MTEKTNLKALTRDEIIRFMGERGLPRYRADQLLHWIYRKYVSAIQDITEFSKDLRNILDETAFISNLRLIKRLTSSDGTEKFLFSLEDGQTIESVLIPDKDRLTLCISSQVGCAMGCRFCLTGRLGLIRNLRSYEIADQLTAVSRVLHPGKRITNIVFMGMGEPLANFDEVVDALWKIVRFTGISKRRITLSTSGLVPQILRLGDMAPEVNLAVSLNATTDVSRDSIMPVNRKYPIRKLLEACRRFPLRPGRRITFEYVLVDGVNDSPEDAQRLVGLLRGLRCKVNLIPLNPLGEYGLQRPPDHVVLKFQSVLVGNHMTAIIRESKGQDILAACGQLRAACVPGQ